MGKSILKLTVNREIRQANDLRVVLFYGISLLLSLILVIISTTVFIVVIYLEGSVGQSFFFLFIGILASNLLISGFSLMKLLKVLPAFSANGTGRNVYKLNEKGSNSITGHQGINTESIEAYFTSAELEIIELLKENGNRMLQSSMVSNLGTSKATISRAISSLENKGAVIRLRKGVTNEIILSETYFK